MKNGSAPPHHLPKHAGGGGFCFVFFSFLLFFPAGGWGRVFEEHNS